MSVTRCYACDVPLQRENVSPVTADACRLCVPGRNLWIVYDERAAMGDTEDAAVLESCRSEHEAMRKALPGIVFRYDILPALKAGQRDELINETLIGPNVPLQREHEGLV